MGKSSQAKLDYVKSLLQAGIPYRDIQDRLKQLFGSGVSNTTLQNLVSEIEQEGDVTRQLEQCQQELALYKKLYFEMLTAMKEKLGKIP